MKRIILMAIALSAVLSAHSQDFVDNALLFGRTKPGGSARIQALGGTQVSLGGDYSSAASNPAGLGMFNRSEFTISPGVNVNSTSSKYFGTTTDDSRSVFNIPGLSLVLNMPSERESGFLGGSFGFSLTRTNDFNQNYTIRGVNNESSIIDYFIRDAGDIDPNELFSGGSYFYSLTGLAYNNYLITDLQDEQGIYYSSLANFSSGTQKEVSQRKGAQYQWSLSYGANFSDKFFLGATLGITSLRFRLNQVYSEDNLQYPQDANVAVKDLKVEEDYDIQGSGFNFTIGAIYRPVDFLQIGASLVTPTSYSITDTYTARVESTWNMYNNGDPAYPTQSKVWEEFDRPVVSDYTLRTPMRFTTGATLISKIGFISADVEFVNYAKGKYRSDFADEFQLDNEDIKADYASVMNYRVGAEYRYQKFRVRGGFNYMTNPLRDTELNRSITSFSGGLGYKEKSFYIDLAAVHSQSDGRRIPYFPGDGRATPVATQEYKSMNYILTLGFTF